MGDKIKLQFNSELDYQIAAIESTVNLFNGQGSDVSYFTFSGQQSLDSQYGIANKLNLRKDDLLKNLEDVIYYLVEIIVIGENYFPSLMKLL